MGQISTPLRAAAYARFSSEMQRDESIDAQLRAIREYAKKNGAIVVQEYIDRAHTATTDQRPAFQQMITDAKRGAFNLVIVHKLDRFSRNRYDSVFYRRELKIVGVELRSVLENLDGSPESVLLESLLEGINEFYSRNLAREVQKGKKENALQAKHVGGIPPLGYVVNPQTMLLELDLFEAQAVKLIFNCILRVRVTQKSLIRSIERDIEPNGVIHSEKTRFMRFSATKNTAAITSITSPPRKMRAER